MICTFFGHKLCTTEIREELRLAIIDLIKNKGVNKFYVGNQGGFDYIVRNVLKELSNEYPIKYNIVLAYFTLPKSGADDYEPENTILPEGIEFVPLRFAIDWRNKWMVKQSDFVITYVEHSFGGAAKFKAFAQKQNKTVINLCSTKHER